jgi:hypothetical protein
LKRVRSYEEHHKNRKILFERPDRKIGDGSLNLRASAATAFCPSVSRLVPVEWCA